MNQKFTLWRSVTFDSFIRFRSLWAQNDRLHSNFSFGGSKIWKCQIWPVGPPTTLKTGGVYYAKFSILLVFGPYWHRECGFYAFYYSPDICDHFDTSYVHVAHPYTSEQGGRGYLGSYKGLRATLGMELWSTITFDKNLLWQFLLHIWKALGLVNRLSMVSTPET